MCCNEPINLECVALDPRAVLPSKASQGDAGLDLHCMTSVILVPGERVLVSTGISMAIPEGYYGQIKDRSGNAFKKGVHCFAGVIDSPFRGEVKVLLCNLGREAVGFESGDRVAQMVILPVPHVNVKWVSSLSSTDRGAGGFGSTGN